MAYHYKKRKYKIKPLPIIVLLVLIIVLIWIAYIFINKANNKTPSSSLPNSQIASTSSDVSSQLSSQVSSVEQPNSSDNTSSKLASSLPSSSKPPQQQSSSEKLIPVTRDENPKITIDDPYVATVGSKGAWNLILLNNIHYIQKDLGISKTKFDTQWIDSRIAPAYEKMCVDAKKSGITLFLRSGYRSISEQRVNYNASIDRKIKAGYSREQAILLTDQYYAKPGHSEHHTGLALDIITPQYHNDIYTLDERFAKTIAYEWLLENCAEYGFILRYPKGKESITQINFEPWHYRYVGVQHAKYIMENKITLEEFYK